MTNSNLNPHEVIASEKTDNPSLILLQRKGYKLWLEKQDHSNEYSWCASKDGRGFMGHSGADLLGIVTLWERLQENWNQRTPGILDELFEEMDDPYEDEE
ncbi:hypothetical protein [Gimesia chilikensis]|uniref:hypothetical protein n=1 Tax=Gimesia chilikensis TaxID=2605989 RepID=UPI00118A0268|nr:hypothetical protein [Gimesia chilikensis]QDT88284.1 hypothetical protein MalM14_59810 [Gimesia chilikensis]